MFCPECGKTVEERAVFCPNCGAKVGDTLQVASPTSQPIKNHMLRKISPAIFGIALICFFLPWVNVSCAGQKVAAFKGIQLVTGTTIEVPGIYEDKKVEKVKGEVLAILVFLSAVIGFVLSFLKGKKGNLGPAIVGGFGTILLLLLTVKLDNDISREGEGMLQLNYTVGFYLTLILFLSAIGINIYSMVREKAGVLSQNKKVKIQAKFCAHCGAKLESDSAFCPECGHSLS
ncbi:MAG: zinc-ribbon domain-containing protein [Nitrospirota bacterium]